MSRSPATVAFLFLANFLLWPNTSPAAEKPNAPTSGHYLFAWTGDQATKGNDFLAVIDADPVSPSYGHLVTTLATDQPTGYVHHTEYTMPASGMLFANDHYAGKTFIFDLHDPLHPAIVTSFTDMDGYMHPHSFVRLPNSHVLATFQHTHREMNSDSRLTTLAKSSARRAMPIQLFPTRYSHLMAWSFFRNSTASSPRIPPCTRTMSFAG